MEAVRDARGEGHEAPRGALRLLVMGCRGQGGCWELGSGVSEGNSVRVSRGLPIYILGWFNWIGPNFMGHMGSNVLGI